MLYLALMLRFLVGGVFLVSFLTKVSRRTSFGEFVASVRGMRILPDTRVAPVAAAVVASEFLICLLLAVPGQRATLVGLVLAAGALLSFALGIAGAVRRGAREPCRCFGVSRTPLGHRHVVRNVTLAALALAGAAACSADGRMSTGGTAVALAAGLLLAWLVVASDPILDLFWPAPPPPGSAGGRRLSAASKKETSWLF
ncbi:MauE/DoxX family redox-associated membrane protein [Streptomyces sp. NPDC058195]|uniref:MauE/DoxX family redox-associated membrane protein n=1 Tax=Streptomyces sp. NPDC058195 TaxID=3346375 RepID=UPI0036E258AC